MTRAALRWWSASLGVVAALAVLAVAEIAAAFVAPAASPVLAVGALVIDLVPAGVKDTVIALFGTGDKVALIVVLGVVVLAAAALAGILQVRRPPLGVVVLALFAGVAMLAATTRAGATGAAAIPTIVGMIAGVFILHRGADRLRDWRDAADRAASASAAVAEPVRGIARPAARAPLTPGAGARVERRTFLLMTVVAGVASVVAGSVARGLNAAAARVDDFRRTLVLPRAATPAAAIPATAELGVPGLAPFVTPATDFYRIDTALQVPSVDAASWKLRITGMVEQEVEITFAELLALPLEEHVTTLTCVSNEIGGNLIGNALWLGYPIRLLLERAKPTTGADMVLSTSQDGWTASTPLEALTDPDRASILAVGMNGEPLPQQHGFPVRMVVPGLYGYVSATKWVTELKVTTFAEDVAYWSTRGWTERGPIKTGSRIDTPRSGARVDAGRTAIAGMAWAQHTGIEKVEVRVDEGDWVEATLGDGVGADTWRQWSYAWDAASGSHSVEVRATDTTGATQTSDEAPPAPDGATGWHRITVGVS
ncbi:molybdopterin-dependent oxidoreductase [Clavibacter michiganensis]|uniref:molybdopterin-dependent oxidoreductase n=1 Tax=Clavibacter michiganensis TaxID=28447 RepID=UPI0009A73E64|nr:molybdopterin-dependent oxidoreductase [Clavibacter michiganensis]MBF4638946.1 molybdopterin-dependent oxidoreductase [Clavibacter michiganensis subsp. michiganensis]MDO4025165.1 molybdopterin-dependent oxidoreductase [Clavibacter michiganensis]MDO4033823.1 molybdopterin-dependent oxidoreductase [Clavibacter michiganensis]MDO4047024.1 molybdopterin-dependent oxidoreductase [Clavibacter michiganensis]MDO4105566.1 molybdopterin-dependent oxidoreductase [Clavibacter michiganensis]